LSLSVHRYNDLGMKKTPIDYGYLVLALGLITVVSTVYGVWRHYSPLPFSDQWDGSIGLYLQALKDPWHAFFAQHNEHRLAVPGLLFFTDVRYFGGRNVLLLIANLVLAGLLAMTFVRIATGQGTKMGRPAVLAITGAALVFCFSWIQDENFTWGFQIQWFAVYLFALTAFYSLEIATRVNTNGGALHSCCLWLATALLCATLSAYSMSSGVLVFPVLALQALHARCKPAVLGLIVFVGTLVWVAYFNDWHFSTSSNTVTAALQQHPLDGLRYVLLYLGAPARTAHLGMVTAYAFGALVLISILTFFIKAAISKPSSVRAASLLAFVVFITLNAVVTAGGRLWIGLQYALASRYTTASLAAWLALILFAALNKKSAKANRWISIASGITILVVFSAQRFVLHDAQSEIYSRLVAGLALRAHVYDPEVTRAIYPFPDQLVVDAKAAEGARVTIFSPEQVDYLVPPKRLHATSTCDGAIDTISPTLTPGVYRATGWIYDKEDGRVPRDVIVTDANGISIGTGVTGGISSEGANEAGRRARYSGWTAFFQKPAAGDAQFSARISGGDYCRMKLGAIRTAATTPLSLD
jgi:hypothetical protein